MLGGFLVESMFSDRSQLPDRFTQRKFNLFVFLAGFPYKDILQFLLTYHNIELTMRHLHRILRKQKLFRKNKIVSSREILNSVAEELKEPGSSYG